MYLQSWMRTSRSMCVAAILAVGLMAGCASKQRLGAAGLPGEQYLVGGGVTIAWKAPETGTIYLVEKKTRKLVETRSLGQGDLYSFSVDSVVRAQELGDILGINLARTEFLLYFEPAGAELPTQAKLTK